LGLRNDNPPQKNRHFSLLDGLDLNDENSVMAVPTDEPDERLMLRVREGDREAFNELMDRYARPVMNVIYRYLEDYDAAQDLMQETFLRVYKARERYEVRSKFSTWLFQIAINLCLNERRSRSYRSHDSLEAMADHQRQVKDSRILHPGLDSHRRELAERVQAAVRALPETERAMVILAKWEEKSYEEIGEIMNCSVDAVKSRLYRAKKMLREKLKDLVKEHEQT
jgi:RNA polymerase sigma-70 factor, ECF subfamily